MCRDAVARLETVLAVVSDLRVARLASAEPAVPFEAPVVPAARVLAEIAADRPDIAQERRGGEGSGARDGGVRLQSRSLRQRCQRDTGTDQDTLSVGVEPVQAGVLQIDEEFGAANAAVGLTGEV